MPQTASRYMRTILGFLSLMFASVANAQDGYSASSKGGGGGTTLAAPSGLTGVAVSTTQINLTWTDTNTVEAGYDVYYRLPSWSNYSPRASLAANATSFQDSSLAAGTTYYYEVRAWQKTSRGKILGPFCR